MATQPGPGLPDGAGEKIQCLRSRIAADHAAWQPKNVGHAATAGLHLEKDRIVWHVLAANSLVARGYRHWPGSSASRPRSCRIASTLRSRQKAAKTQGRHVLSLKTVTQQEPRQDKVNHVAP